MVCLHSAQKSNTEYKLTAAKKQEHELSESEDLCQRESHNSIRITSPNPDFVSGQLPKFSANFLVQRYVGAKIFMKIRYVFAEIWAELWKNARSRKKNPGSGSGRATTSKI